MEIWGDRQRDEGIVQRHGQGCVESSRGLEDPNLLLSAPTGVQNSLLHLRSSWTVKSQKFAPGICSWHYDAYKRTHRPRREE